MFLENLNHLSVFKALYFNGPASCPEISKITGSSIPNIAKNLTELIKAGIVAEKGFAFSKGGRKPLIYTLDANQFYIISVATDQFITKIALVNLNNEFIGEVKSFDFNLNAPTATAANLTNKINGFIAELTIDKAKIYSIGVTIPGFVDTEKGISKSFFKEEEGKLRDYITENTGYPAFLDNDSSAIALAELKFGFGREIKEMMVLNVGWGIGLGMVVKGEIFRGFSGFAGEFSHIPLLKMIKYAIAVNGAAFETEASLILIKQQAEKAIAQGEATTIKPDENGLVDISLVMAEAAQGDALAIKINIKCGISNRRALAVLIHIMNPETIVLSGKGSEAGKLWFAPIQQALNELCIPVLLNDSELVLSNLGVNAQLIGGAALAIEHIDQVVLKKKIQILN